MSLVIYINEDILLWGRLIVVICKYVILVVNFLIEEPCLFLLGEQRRGCGAREYFLMLNRG